MTNDTDSALNLMRREREKYGAIYIQFVNNRQYYNTHAFCFFEGEDGKYYNPRINQKFYDKFFAYTVGNKKEVLKLLHKIRREGIYENVCTMFFIDRDYDESKATLDDDLFETPCYSIENFYVQRECMIQILQSEFGLNMIDDDCKKCLSDFDSREREFNNYILEFNALALLRRKKSESNSNIAFGSIKTSHLVNVKINGIYKSEKYDETIRKIKEELDFEETELDAAKQELIRRGDFSLNFRGKNQLDFFVEFIRELKKLNSQGDYFSTKHNNIHINITSNRLSELTQYAITPQTLDDFLKRHALKLQELIAAS